MSSKTSRRTKSILASLLIASNFVNFKINAMDSVDAVAENRIDEDYQCADEKFILNIFNDFIKYKEDNSSIIKKYQDEFKILNGKDIFNGGLIKNYIYMNPFVRYTVLRTIRAFLDKNEEFKEAFNFCHKKSKKIMFALYDFKVDDNLILKIAETLDVNDKNLYDYADRNDIDNLMGKKLTSGGIAKGVGSITALGLEWPDSSFKDLTEQINNMKMSGISHKGESISIFKIIWGGMSEKSIKKINKLVKDNKLTYDEVDGTICLIYRTLHELAHSISKYLRLLELMVDKKYKSNFDKKFANGLDGVSYAYEVWDEKFKLPELEAKAQELGIDKKTFEYLAKYRESLKKPWLHDLEDSGHTRYSRYKINCGNVEGWFVDVQEFGIPNKPESDQKLRDELRNKDTFKDIKPDEDIPETFTLESMPSWGDFKSRKGLVRAYKIYARKLLEILKTRDDNFKLEALKYMNDFDKEQKKNKKLNF